MAEKKTVLFQLLITLVLFFSVGIANATGNFIPISLPNGVSVELPRNWTVLSNNLRITLDSYVQSKRELAGSNDPSSDLNFAANYYDDKGKTAAIFSVRYYPQQTVTQAESRELTVADTSELDDALRNEMLKVLPQSNIRILSWKGTNKQSINGVVAFVTEYSRASMQGGSPFHVRLVRVLNAGRSLTVTISYREDLQIFLRPICDRVIQSINM